MSEHNGNQELVYNAIARGAHLRGEIAAATGLDPDSVQTHITRLLDAGRIDRAKTPDRRHLTSYIVAKKTCLLAECWK